MKKNRTRRRSSYWLAATLLVAALLSCSSREDRPPGSAAQAANRQSEDDFRLLEQTITRAHAVERLFYRVYSAGWEGANGAIGDAHLYAVTRDSTMPRLYKSTFDMTRMYNGTWVDDRAWICLAEMYWWDFTGRKYEPWVTDAKKRYLAAREEGRLSDHEGFWSWYNWPPNWKIGDQIITNSNMNEMVAVACWLYEATKDERFKRDALLVWNGDAKHPGIEKTFYRGDGRWEGKQGLAAFGKQLPWEGAAYCSIGAAMYRMTGDPKYKDIVVRTARRIMDPANGWVDPTDYYQIKMDGNGAFVHYILDAYLLAPDQLPDIPAKVAAMLEHVWTNHGGTAKVVLHRLSDDGIRNGWNPNGGEDGYGVDQVGNVHPQSQALRAFGVFAYVLQQKLAHHW